MKKIFLHFLGLILFYSVALAENGNSAYDVEQGISIYIKNQGYLPRNRHISKQIDSFDGDITPILEKELESRSDGDELMAIARLAIKIKNKESAQAIVTRVRLKISQIEGYKADPIVADTISKIEHIILNKVSEGDGESGNVQSYQTPKVSLKSKLNVSPLEPTFTKKPSTSEKKPAEPENADPASDNPFPYWIFIIGGVVVVGLAVVLKRK